MIKETLRSGLIAEQQLVVQSIDAISFMGPEVPGVLASPRMLLLMEHAARECVLPHLLSGHDTVGVGFEFEHCGAAPIGSTVTATAELLSVQGRMLHFRIEARDDSEVIGRGRHVRAIVEVRRFAEKMKKKMSGRKY
jgi:fluoroacetyl-CoA thioesterase